MPQIDYLVEKLQIDEGINSKPVDFNEYWQNGCSVLSRSGRFE
jgi:cephalosporin-C deacetylase-like acetyl esterase